MQEQSFFLWKRTDEIKYDQNEKKKKYKAGWLELWKNSRLYHFSRLDLYLPDFFQVWKMLGKFKTLYESCP